MVLMVSYLNYLFAQAKSIQKSLTSLWDAHNRGETIIYFCAYVPYGIHIEFKFNPEYAFGEPRYQVKIEVPAWMQTDSRHQSIEAKDYYTKNAQQLALEYLNYNLGLALVRLHQSKSAMEGFRLYSHPELCYPRN